MEWVVSRLLHASKTEDSPRIYLHGYLSRFSSLPYTVYSRCDDPYGYSLSVVPLLTPSSSIHYQVSSLFLFSLTRHHGSWDETVGSRCLLVLFAFFTRAKISNHRPRAFRGSATCFKIRLRLYLFFSCSVCSGVPFDHLGLAGPGSSMAALADDGDAR